MKVLVTGSEGSLMQWTIDHLLNAGHDVVGIDNRVRYFDYETTRVVSKSRYEFFNADLTDYESTLKCTANADAVINGAALIYGVKGFHDYPADILSNDITVHRNVLEAAREHGIDRVAYVSSSIVYEQDDPPHEEQDVWSARSPSTDYGLSKVVGERLSTAFATQYDIKYTIWRPFNIITPNERSESEPGMSHVFADFIQKIIVEGQNPMEIFGDGEQIRCFTWIGEVSEAIAEYSFAEETTNEAYNLANPEPVTMKELARRIFTKAKQRDLVSGETLEFDHQPIYDDDVDERIPSVEKARRGFGWDPTIKLDDSLERCLDNIDNLYDLDKTTDSSAH